jgi:2-aminoadipate transaminase
VERPTYVGALQAWNAYQAEFVAADTDHDGYLIESVRTQMRSGPKFIYALPNFQNPSGVTLSLERRHALIDVADHYGVPILEDDPYGQLRYEDEHLPSLVTLDSQFRNTNGEEYSGNVIYLSTFSKTLAPGVRLGWIVAPVEVIQKLVQAKQGADLHSGTLNQMLAFEVASDGFLDLHVKHIRSVYGERRDTMLAALTRHFPEDVTWTRPKGGLFLWLTFPEFMDAAEILKAAVEQRVAFVPGQAFFADGGGGNNARLNFSNANPEMIEEGIKRLARVLKQLLVGAH